MRKKGQGMKFYGAILQMLIIVSASFAFAFLISPGVGFASAVDPGAIENGPVVVSPGPAPMIEVSPAVQEAKNLLNDVQQLKSAAPNPINSPAHVTTLRPQDLELTTRSATESVKPAEFKLFGKPLATGGTAHLLQGVQWAVVVVGVIQLIGTVAGLDRSTTNALSIAAFAGIMAGKGLASLGPSGFSSSTGGIIKSGIFTKPGVQFGVGVLVAVAVFILLYKKEKKQLVNFQCLPWEPKIGGAKCEECNKDSFRPCSEYRCKSLGQACQLLNAGTKEEKCAWVNPRDVNSPTIQPWNDALKPRDLKYIPDTSIRPPALGVKIQSSSGSQGCLPAFTPLQFGILTNEPAQCKLDYNHTSSFDSMQFFFGESNYYSYNHTQKMRLPGPNSAGSDLSPLLKNDGTMSLYVRCRDANGNENVDEYSTSFCVDAGPDTTPAVIEGFNIPSGSSVTYNQQNVAIEAYVNEPVECKWSRESKSYQDMENSMACNKEAYQVNADLQYVCSGNLTGIKNKEDNKFYFRCKDQPDKPENERNPNVQSTELILKGSQPLNILSTGPNQTIFGSLDIVPLDLTVETDDGANEGKAICYYSSSGNKDSYITMFETSGFKHSQKLNLPAGDYKFYFRCVDAGGNAAEGLTGFAVFSDKQAPKVTRAYKQEALKIVTDEDAECRYSLSSCNYNFNDGLKMIYSNPDQKRNLFAEWKPSNTYYIKCRDFYGNEPEPNKCSIVVNAIDLEKKEA